ncbi:hypothetical protein B0H19DRAFT_1061888 [Mycena capillaripes]|nr:hypothetical protein B0H19DRAFT_1061888 [Mycena capillaripes]
MSKGPVKTLYTAKFYEPLSSSESTHPSSSKPQPSTYMEKLFKTHVALNQMEEVPSHTPNPGHNERVEALRKQVVEQFKACNGNPANGKWGLLVNLLQTSTAKGNYRYVNTRTDVLPPQPGPDGWLLAETEEEWLTWERKRKDEQRLAQDKKRKEELLLKEKVETWKRDIDTDPVTTPELPDIVPETPSPPAKVTRTIPSDDTKSKSVAASKSRARSIADLPEAFLPPSFPSHLETSTPPTANRHKPSPIELVPSSSPLSSPNKDADLPGPSRPKPSSSPSKLVADNVPSSSPLSSPPKNSRVYGRPRPAESPLKRGRSSSPTPLNPAKKTRPTLPASPGAAIGSVAPSSSKPAFKMPFTPPRNTLPKLEDLLAASAQKQKSKAKAKEKGKGKAKEPAHNAKPQSKPSKSSPVESIASSDERQRELEARIDVMEDDVIDWDATLERMMVNQASDGDVSPTKSLSSINDSNSLESQQNSMDLPDFSNGAPFDPQGGSTQPMGRLEAGESLGTTERGGRGFGQPLDIGFPMRYESQMDVESNMQGVEELLDADVGGYTGPWMGTGLDGDEDEQWARSLLQVNIRNMYIWYPEGNESDCFARLQWDEYMTGLEDLPVELLYEVHLYSLSTALPITSRRLYHIFNAAPASFRAQYILSHFEPEDARLSDVVSKILRFPLCSMTVLDAVFRTWPVAAPASTLEEIPPLSSPSGGQTKPPEVEAPPDGVGGAAAAPTTAPELPRRLFRALGPRTDRAYNEDDAPLPLIRYLYASTRIAPPNPNSHEGYALTRAVHAEFVPLIQLLLEHGASPQHKRGLAVLVAIRQKKLSLVRMLIERTETGVQRGAKKRKLEDRMEVTSEMLKAAVKAKARDIAEYLMQEKGCVPDIQTLHMLMR